jgi:hypothetical protein
MSGLTQDRKHMIVVLSGSFNVEKDRRKLKEELEAKGVKVADQVTKNASVLCVGKGAKLYKTQEAEFYSIPIVDESFLHHFFTSGRFSPESDRFRITTSTSNQRTKRKASRTFLTNIKQSPKRSKKSTNNGKYILSALI